MEDELKISHIVDFRDAADEPSHPPIMDWTERDARGRLLAATLGTQDRCCDARHRATTNAHGEQGHTLAAAAAFRTLQGLHDRGFALLDRPVEHDDFVSWEVDQPAKHREFAFEPMAVRDVMWPTGDGRTAVLRQQPGNDEMYEWVVTGTAECVAPRRPTRFGPGLQPTLRI